MFYCSMKLTTSLFPFLFVQHKPEQSLQVLLTLFCCCYLTHSFFFLLLNIYHFLLLVIDGLIDLQFDWKRDFGKRNSRNPSTSKGLPRISIERGGIFCLQSLYYIALDLLDWSRSAGILSLNETDGYMDGGTKCTIYWWLRQNKYSAYSWPNIWQVKPTTPPPQCDTYPLMYFLLRPFWIARGRKVHFGAQNRVRKQ